MSDFDDFIALIHTTRDQQLLEDLLIGVTTTQEREAIVQRIEIIKCLIAGEPQAKIAKELGVGIATVTRGSKELSLGRFKVLRNQSMKAPTITTNFSHQDAWQSSHRIGESL